MSLPQNVQVVWLKNDTAYVGSQQRFYTSASLTNHRTPKNLQAREICAQGRRGVISVLFIYGLFYHTASQPTTPLIKAV